MPVEPGEEDRAGDGEQDRGGRRQPQDLAAQRDLAGQGPEDPGRQPLGRLEDRQRPQARLDGDVQAAVFAGLQVFARVVASHLIPPYRRVSTYGFSF
jgi:hypothetical protein